jgi:hypothetical protein
MKLLRVLIPSNHHRYNLIREGRAPEIVWLGRDPYVTEAAEAKWLEACREYDASPEAVAKRELRREANRRAAQASLKSPKHVINRRRRESAKKRKRA